MNILVLLVVGVVASSLERWLFPERAPVSFLGSVLLAWCGAAAGGLLAPVFGVELPPGFSIMRVAVASVGVLLVLGGLRTVNWARHRSGQHHDA
jgi:uncharacterized membrane protein YeaQ/YmgE (transglycosylase-associated protein family)